VAIQCKLFLYTGNFYIAKLFLNGVLAGDIVGNAYHSAFSVGFYSTLYGFPGGSAVSIKLNRVYLTLFVDTSHKSPTSADLSTGRNQRRLFQPHVYPVGSFLKSYNMKKMLDILQCSSLYIVRIWNMPFISPFSILLCETLGKIQPLSTSRGFLFYRKPVLSPG